MMAFVVVISLLAVLAMAIFFWLRRQMPDADMARLELDPSQLPGLYYRRTLDDSEAVFVAGAVVDITGYTADQFDAGLARYDDLLTSEDRAAIRHAVDEARQGDGAYAVEYRVLTRLGEVRWVYDRGRVRIDKRGKLCREGMVIDISQRKIHESRQREQESLRHREQQELVRLATLPAVIEGRLTEAAQAINEVAASLLLVERVGLWVISNDGNTLTNLDVYERTARRHTADFSIVVTDYPHYFAALKRGRAIDAVDAGTDPRTAELAVAYLSRREIVSMLDTPVLVAGEVRGVLCLESVRQRRQWTVEETSFAAELAGQFAGAINNQGRRNDARARRELEGELIQAQKMEAVGHLTAGIAHDFNNIITAVSGYTSLARQYAGRDPDMLNSCLSRIDDSVRRSRLLVKQLIKFGSASSAVATRIDLGAQLTETMDFLRAVLPSSVEVESNLSLSELTVLFDADQLDQVILNLALNAADAMSGQGLLHISTDVAQPGEGVCDACNHSFAGSYAMIRLSDTGAGIADDVRRQIFEPFFTTKGAERGTGLGLAMVNRLIHEYGGHVLVTSEVGRGTLFTLHLPMVETPVPVEKPAQGVAPILVVDDDVGAASFILELLMSQGYRVQAVSNPHEAIRIVREHPGEVRLIITDYSMPEMDGVALSCEVHAINSALPILLVSGYGADINIADFGSHNIQAMFAKPIETDKLLAAVRRIMGGMAV